MAADSKHRYMMKTKVYVKGILNEVTEADCVTTADLAKHCVEDSGNVFGDRAAIEKTLARFNLTAPKALVTRMVFRDPRHRKRDGGKNRWYAARSWCPEGDETAWRIVYSCHRVSATPTSDAPPPPLVPVEKKVNPKKPAAFFCNVLYLVSPQGSKAIWCTRPTTSIGMVVAQVATAGNGVLLERARGVIARNGLYMPADCRQSATRIAKEDATVQFSKRQWWFYGQQYGLELGIIELQ